MSGLPSAHDPSIRADDDGKHAMAVFPRSVTSVGAARHWLAGYLARHRVDSATAADAGLVLSELVTNALRHGLGDIVTRSSVGTAELRMSVTDSGEGVPVRLPPDPNRIGGLGLVVVDTVTQSWGVAPFPGGKTVWATLSLHR